MGWWWWFAGESQLIRFNTSCPRRLDGIWLYRSGGGDDRRQFKDVVGKESLPPFDFPKARRILELCFFAFLSSLDTLAMLRESELLLTVNEFLLLDARRALLSMPSIADGDAITRMSG